MFSDPAWSKTLKILSALLCKYDYKNKKEKGGMNIYI